MRPEASREAPSAVFEGAASIRAVLESGSRAVLRVLCDRERAEARADELRFLRSRGIEPEFTDADTIAALAVGTSHGGLIAECGDRDLPCLKKAALPARGFFVMLEGIEDPYNFGYALRSLYAAGVDGFALPPRNWMSAAGVVCRASAGASERAALYTAPSAADAARTAHDAGYRVVCADTGRGSVDMYSADLRKPLLLIIGGERRGISRAVLDCADLIVRIPYGRRFPAALSAASASTVLGFEVLRQNRV